MEHNSVMRPLGFWCASAAIHVSIVHAIKRQLDVDEFERTSKKASNLLLSITVQTSAAPLRLYPFSGHHHAHGTTFMSWHKPWELHIDVRLMNIDMLAFQAIKAFTAGRNRGLYIRMV